MQEEITRAAEGNLKGGPSSLIGFGPHRDCKETEQGYESSIYRKFASK
jgi:hypothetical protein